jgi:hypothetical protein
MHRIVWGKETGGYARRAASYERRSRCGYSAQGKRRGAISIGQEREIGGTAQDAWLFGEARSRYVGTVKSDTRVRIRVKRM